MRIWKGNSESGYSFSYNNEDFDIRYVGGINTDNNRKITFCQIDQDEEITTKIFAIDDDII